MPFSQLTNWLGRRVAPEPAEPDQNPAEDDVEDQSLSSGRGNDTGAKSKADADEEWFAYHRFAARSRRIVRYTR